MNMLKLAGAFLMIVSTASVIAAPNDNYYCPQGYDVANCPNYHHKSANYYHQQQGSRHHGQKGNRQGRGYGY